MHTLLLLPLLLKLFATAPSQTLGTRYQGAFSNGVKGDTISFVLSADGKTISDLAFKGYWRCAGKLQLLAAPGPRGTYTVSNGTIADRLCEGSQKNGPDNCFELSGKINGAAANGKLRLRNTAKQCDSDQLLWSAVAVNPTK
ncbi:MAG: hypothetical protein EOO56_21630 [Hymenobacter sp.]|nr:MAG: hypothetical protein EOO56_21630 [Hymenobacter sp.]